MLAEELKIKDRFVFLGVARIEYFKGILTVVRALNELRKSNTDFIYLHIGSGNTKFREYVWSIVHKMGLQDNFKFLGKFPYNQLKDLYRLSDAFILPSLPTLLWEEQLGFSLLEAMSTGKPAIVSDTPTLREVVTDGTGFLSPPGNYLELAKKMRTVMEDKEMSNIMGLRARKQILDHFDARITAKNYLRVYKEILE
jgi:glycosyltransferase involved in cell wall biosynthesis